MTNTTNNCASYLVGSDNGIISYVASAAGRSRLQAGTLVIFLTRAAQEQTRFMKLASLRAGGNRKQRTEINLILHLFRAIHIFFYLVSTNCPYENKCALYYYYFIVYSFSCFGYI